MSSLYPRRFLLIAILLLAFLLRVIAIDHIPPGLSHDEAYNGITAMQVLNGQRLIFFEINKGIEPLIIYLEALAFAAFGIGPVAMRLVNVMCGMLTVALVYPLALRLFNRRVALLAMAGLASANDVDLVETLSTNPAEEMIVREALGLPARGDTKPAINPSGGPITGHPFMMTGLIRLGEAFRQLSGTADGHAVPNAKRAIVHAAQGHCLQQNLVFVLGRERRWS